MRKNLIMLAEGLWQTALAIGWIGAMLLLLAGMAALPALLRSLFSA